MIEGIPRISALVICYKQEKLVGRALNSLIAQKDYLYEICVSDDCSPDSTWQVLLDYQRRYPDLVKIHRNEPNVGIFENIEQSWKMPSGDLIYQLSGDDEAGEGWFKKVVEYIQNEGLDYKNERLCIYGDFKCIYPNGDSFVFKNDAIPSGVDAVRLAIRKFIGGRSACFSVNVLNKFEKVSRGRSYEAEGAQDRMLQYFTEKNYYIPYVGNIYYTGVGVNRHLSNSDIEEVFDKGVTYNREVLERLGYSFNKKDLYYMSYYIEKNKFIHSRSLVHLFKAIALYLKAFDWTFKLDSFRLPIYLFAIKRRLLHSKPINWIVSHHI